MTRHLALLAMLATVPGIAPAQPTASGRAEVSLRAADAALNIQWKRTVAAVRAYDAAVPPGGRADLLRSTQRMWLSFRDEHCGVVGSLLSPASPTQATALTLCHAELTRQRTAQLAKLVPQQ